MECNWLSLISGLCSGLGLKNVLQMQNCEYYMSHSHKMGFGWPKVGGLAQPCPVSPGPDPGPAMQGLLGA